VSKNTVIAFVIGLALGILGTAGFILIGQSGDPGGLAELDRAVQQQAAVTVGELERTVNEQRERIDNLQASNTRLEECLGDARRISAELTVAVESESVDIRSAIVLLKKITDQVKSLNGVLGGGDSGLHGAGGLPGPGSGGSSGLAGSDF
jgi:hypothetical protein